jgi:hypothetical protein
MTENQNVIKKDQEVQSGFEQLENFDKENNHNNNFEKEEQNIQNNEELVNENKSNIIEQRNIIQSQLKFICNKIEDALNTYHIKKLEKEREKDEMNKAGIKNLEIKPIAKEINNYKEQSKKIQDEIDNIYNNTMLDNLENRIREKRNYIKEMKRENQLLKKATKGQEKDINEYINKNNNVDETETLKLQIKKLKEALKITKDFHKEQEIKLKEQQNQIDTLEKKKKLIKDNIEFKKKKMKNEKNKKDNEDNENKEENYEKYDIYTLDEKKYELASQIDIEEKKYKEQINNQKILIDNFNKDIEILKIKLKSIEQNKKMEEIKKKEEKKIKLKEIKNKKLQNEMMNNNNMIKNYQVKRRGYSRDSNNSRFNNLNNIYNNNNTHNNQLSILPNINNNKRNFNQFRTNKTPNKIDKKFKKPFEIGTFFQNNTRTQRRPHTQLGNVFDRRNKLSTLNQIEQLKNDIQNTLKNNAFIIEDKNNSNNNSSGNNNHIKGYDKINEPSTIIGTNVNNDISDIKNDIEYLNDLGIGNFEKITMKQTNDMKRKPFEKINFK